ncbi:MAG: cation transporter, partial [Propionibacteriaceae bacterium]|nr:cation transporter [Propionibacteriaceae bacterium]
MTTRMTFDIEGMSCAACVARTEKKLMGLPGVFASVNLATKQADVTMPEGVSAGDIIARIEAAGFSAHVRQPDPEPVEDQAGGLRLRMIVCAVLALPVAVLAMVPGVQFPGWQWVSLGLALPVVSWGAWGFYRAAGRNLRHGAATMDTLVSLGIVAAVGWS